MIADTASRLLARQFLCSTAVAFIYQTFFLPQVRSHFLERQSFWSFLFHITNYTAMALNTSIRYPEDAVLGKKNVSDTFTPNIPDDNRQLTDMASVYDDDERLLARIGYRQVWASMCLTGTTNSILIIVWLRNCGANFQNGRQFHMPFPSWESWARYQRHSPSPSRLEAQPRWYGAGLLDLVWQCVLEALSRS